MLVMQRLHYDRRDVRPYCVTKEVSWWSRDTWRSVLVSHASCLCLPVSSGRVISEGAVESCIVLGTCILFIGEPLYTVPSSSYSRLNRKTEDNVSVQEFNLAWEERFRVYSARGCKVWGALLLLLFLKLVILKVVKKIVQNQVVWRS